MASFLADFGTELPDTITVLPVTSRDSYGQAVYGTPVTFDGRVMYKTQLSLNDKGEEKSTRIEVLVATAAQTDITPYSRITLPDGTVETIWSVAWYRDENNLHHHTTLRL